MRKMIVDGEKSDYLKVEKKDEREAKLWAIRVF